MENENKVSPPKHNSWGVVKMMLIPESWLQINRYYALELGIELALYLDTHKNVRDSVQDNFYRVTREQLEDLTTLNPARQIELEDELIARGIMRRYLEGLPKRIIYELDVPALNALDEHITSNIH